MLHNFDYVTFTSLDLLVSRLKLGLAGWADKPVFEKKKPNNCQGICIAVRCRRSEKWQWSDSGSGSMVILCKTAGGSSWALEPSLFCSGVCSEGHSGVAQRSSGAVLVHTHVLSRVCQCALLSPPGSQIFEGTGQCQSALFDYWCLCPSFPLRMHTNIRTQTHTAYSFPALHRCTDTVDALGASTMD